MAEVIIGIPLRIHVRPVLVLVQEVLHTAGDGGNRRRQRGRQLLQRQHGAAVLVALAAPLVLVVDDVLPDVAVNVLVAEVGASSSKNKKR